MTIATDPGAQRFGDRLVPASVRRLKGESLERMLVRLAEGLRDYDQVAKVSRRGDAGPALRKRLRAAQMVAQVVAEIGASAPGREADA